MQAGMVLKNNYMSYIFQETGSQPTVTLREAGKKRDLKACPHSDALPSTRTHILKVPLPLEAISFKAPQMG